MNAKTPMLKAYVPTCQRKNSRTGLVVITEWGRKKASIQAVAGEPCSR